MSLAPVNTIPSASFPKPKGAFDRLGEAYSALLLSPLDAVGLLDRPLLRGAIFAGLTAAVLLYVKPEAQFRRAETRPWSLTNPQNPDATPFPWFVVAGTVGSLTALLI